MHFAAIGRMLLLSSVAFLSVVVPAGVVLPAIPDVPGSIAPESLRGQLEKKKLELLEQRKALHARVDALRDGCRGVEKDSEKDRQCHAEKGRLETEMPAHANAVQAFRLALTDALKAAIDELHKLIKRDEDAIHNNLAWTKRGEDLEAWEALSASAQAEFEQQTEEALMESALALGEAGVQIGTKKLGSLSPPMANRWITQLREAGVTNPDVFDGIRAIAQTSGKPEMAARVLEVIERLKTARDIHAIGNVGNNGDSGKWKAAAAGLSLMIHDPKLNALAQLSLQDARFFLYSANNNLTRQIALYEVDGITSLNEQQLKVLHDSLFPVLEKHVKELNRVKLDLQRLTSESAQK